MSATGKLSSFYGSLFRGATKFAFSPYTSVFMNIAKKDKGDVMIGLMLGFMACAVLTVVPVLPVCTAITFALSLSFALLSMASMFATYPVAFIKDGVSACLDNSSSRPDYHGI